MSFEFHLPPLEEMRATPDGVAMLRMIDDDTFRSALVSGCPGSGKTTVSIYRFVRLSSQGRNVNLVTFQNMLVLSIQNLANVRTPESVSTFHRWYRSITGEYFNVDEPPDPVDMRTALNASSLHNNQMDEFIVDEGQDLPLCVFQTISHFCRRIFIGADDGQKIHRHGAPEEEIARILDTDFGPYRRYNLGRNFRNTYETYVFARQFLPATNLTAWDENIPRRLISANRRGTKPSVVTYRDSSLRDQHLITTLRNADGNVAILCPQGERHLYAKPGECVDEMYDLLIRNGIEATKYHNTAGVPDTLQRYIVTTYKSAKGMEFDVVVIPRINYFQRIPKQWYVACTRAKRQVIIYRDLRQPQVDPLAAFDEATYDAESVEGQSASIAF